MSPTLEYLTEYSATHAEFSRCAGFASAVALYAAAQQFRGDGQPVGGEGDFGNPLDVLHRAYLDGVITDTLPRYEDGMVTITHSGNALPPINAPLYHQCPLRTAMQQECGLLFLQQLFGTRDSSEKMTEVLEALAGTRHIRVSTIGVQHHPAERVLRLHTYIGFDRSRRNALVFSISAGTLTTTRGRAFQLG